MVIQMPWGRMHMIGSVQTPCGSTAMLREAIVRVRIESI
jgi:hypothetical protein